MTEDDIIWHFRNKKNKKNKLFFRTRFLFSRGAGSGRRPGPLPFLNGIGRAGWQRKIMMTQVTWLRDTATWWLEELMSSLRTAWPDLYMLYIRFRSWIDNIDECLYVNVIIVNQWYETISTSWFVLNFKQGKFSFSLAKY